MSISKLTYRIMIIFIFLGLGQQAFAATYYVAKDGNDSRDGFSPNTAWRTISKANNVLQPNDTVFVMNGEYRETIAPNQSGTSGKYITYRVPANNSVVITNINKGAILSGKRNIIIDGFKFVQTDSYWVEMNKATHCIIKNCSFNTAGSYQGIFMDSGANYNKILNNKLVGTASGPNDLIWCFDSKYNLFDGNDFQFGTHNGLNIQMRSGNRIASYHVVRNNRFRNPYHTGLSFWNNADSNLIENNVILDCGSKYDECYGIACSDKSMLKADGMSHWGIQLGSSNNVFRNNVLANNGAMAIDAFNKIVAKNNRIYGNTFYSNYKGIRSTPYNEVSNNVLKNNIFYKQKQYNFYMVLADTSRDRNYIENNAIFGSSLLYKGTKGDLSLIENTYQGEWKQNYETDPKFVALDKQDFRLQSSSPLRNKGAFLTRAVSSGSGTLLTVYDARYFTNGFGLIPGDTIQLAGQTATAKIVSIDYGKNQIKLDKSLSWSKNTGVATAYKENAPDIGAHEYGGGGASPLIDTNELAPPSLMILGK